VKSSATTRKPTDVDQHVGHKITVARKALDMSLEDLADELGISFQQVQKYANGKNRVSVSRLWQLSMVLKVHVSYFFDGLSDGKPVTDDPVSRIARLLDYDDVNDIVGLDRSDWKIVLSVVRALKRGDSLRR
jgi:transcriptional regulator with XRE-family HTH domain